MISHCQLIAFLFVVTVAWVLVFASTSQAQFDTVINVPPNVLPNSIGSDTQLNVFDGRWLSRVAGAVSVPFQAGLPDGSSNNVEVNIFGGRIGDDINVSGGSEFNIFGGRLGGAIDVFEDSELNIFGGAMGRLSAHGGSEINVFGGMGDGIRVRPGGEANIFGGTFGELSAGGHPARLSQETARLSITGSTAISKVGAIGESQVVIDDGEVDFLWALAGSTITVSGGTISKGFVANPDSRLILSGGVFPSLSSRFDVESKEGSKVTILGSSFRVDGTLIEGLANPGDAIPFDLPLYSTLTGDFSDGASFAFRQHPDYLATGTLMLQVVTLLEGDFNNNGTVEQGDLDLVLMNWGERLFNPYDAGWINDMPGGAVDQEELDEVLLNWGTRVDVLAGAAVPEPTSAVLGIVMLALAIAKATHTLFVTRPWLFRNSGANCPTTR